jgi:SNF family Na+-dependent transporter
MNLTIGGVPVLDLIDKTAGSLGLPLTALIMAVVFGWILDPRLFRERGELKGSIPLLVFGICRYLIPPVLLVTLLLLGIGIVRG